MIFQLRSCPIRMQIRMQAAFPTETCRSKEKKEIMTGTETPLVFFSTEG